MISGANFLLDVIPYRHSDAALILGWRSLAQGRLGRSHPKTTLEQCTGEASRYTAVVLRVERSRSLSASHRPWHALVVSKAFTKDDGADEPPLVAPRAPLPAGAPNYVTPRGLALLRSELASLEGSRSSIPLEAGADAASARAALQFRIQELKARLQSAVLVDNSERRSEGEVRFGARVMVG